MQTRQNPAREGKKEAKIYNEAKLSTQTFTLSPPPQVAKNESKKKTDTNTEKPFDPSNPYAEIIVQENFDDDKVQCDICLDKEYEDEDQIVLCDLCNAATHQGCYGGSILK